MVYRAQQFYVQYKMSLAINDSKISFEKLVLTIDEYNKSRLNSREISYKGKMYDVKSVNITTGKIELVVINDVKEKKLLEEIKGFLKKSNQSKNELPDQLQKFLSLNYVAANEGQLVYIPSFYSNIFNQPKNNISSDFPDNPSPPPKSC